MIRINVDVPKSMIEIARDADKQHKPHEICLNCPFRHKSCAGPGITSMEYLDWVEWVNVLAKQQGLTHSIIAERKGLSKATVDSVLSGKNKDVRFSTIRDITMAVIGDKLGRFPCHFAAQLIAGELAQDDLKLEETEKELVRAREELANMLRALEEIHASYQVELQTVRAEAKEKVEYLKAESAKKDVIIDRLLTQFGK